MVYALQKQKTSKPKIKFIFMTQKMDLKKMGLKPLNAFEMQEVDGGLIGLDDLALIGMGY
jgi:hypothetical protein